MPLGLITAQVRLVSQGSKPLRDLSRPFCRRAKNEAGAAESPHAQKSEYAALAVCDTGVNNFTLPLFTFIFLQVLDAWMKRLQHTRHSRAH
jgi:hypothetical protein